MIDKKIFALQKLARAQNLDALILINFGHEISDDVLYYLLLKELELGLMTIPRSGRPTLWGIPFETAQWAKKYPELNVKPFNKRPEELLHGYAGKRLGFRPGSLPTALYDRLKKIDGVELVPLTGEETVMALKLPEEVRVLKKAARLTDELFSQLVRNWRRFKIESDAARFLQVAMSERGIEPSFPTIVASGSNAANPHHETAEVKLRRGFCVIDMGVRYKGYCSDMTRTIFIGTPNAKEIELYKRVREAQQKTTALVAPGVTTPDLDSFCREQLNELNEEFIHGLGHGVGTQVHEWPRVGSAERTALEPGMLITIEPGVYRAGKYGIRIEDDVLVTARGHEVLTASGRSLTRVPAV